MITVSVTIILAPSHRVGIVRLNASNRSCASRVTPLPRRASPSCIFATALASRFFKARMSRACSGGVASEKEVDSEATERSWKDWIREMGMMW